MPLYREGTLKPKVVHSPVAFLLYKNGVIQEDEVMGPESLPNVKMPNRDGFAFPPDWKRGAFGSQRIAPKSRPAGRNSHR